MADVTLVDYGTGNLLSVMRAFQHLEADLELAKTPAAVRNARRLVVPGVGAFGDCMAGLRRHDLIGAIREFAASGRPYLGICVGMQMLFEHSSEFGEHEGLGLLAGRVDPIPATGADGTPHKIPHIGWSSLIQPDGCRWDGTLLGGVASGTAAYFLHSFAGYPADPADLLALTDYDGRPVTAAVRRANVMGTQFHPEKSGEAGLSMLKTFMGGN